MVTLLAKLLLSAVMGAAACAGPDEFAVGYQHQFAGDASIGGYKSSMPISYDDSDYLGFTLTWHLRPRRVVVESVTKAPELPPEMRWTLLPQDVGTSEGTPVSEDVQDPAEAVGEVAGQVTETLETFDSLDWITRLGLLVAVCWLGWVYRERLGKLIPGGNGKSK